MQVRLPLALSHTNSGIICRDMTELWSKTPISHEERTKNIDMSAKLRMTTRPRAQERIEHTVNSDHARHASLPEGNCYCYWESTGNLFWVSTLGLILKMVSKTIDLSKALLSRVDRLFLGPASALYRNALRYFTDVFKTGAHNAKPNIRNDILIRYLMTAIRFSDIC